MAELSQTFDGWLQPVTKSFMGQTSLLVGLEAVSVSEVLRKVVWNLWIKEHVPADFVK